MKKNTSKEVKKYSHLSFEEREEMAIGLEKGLKQCEIAKLLNRSPSTISREIKRKSDSIPFDIQQVRTISIDTTDIYSLVPKLEIYKSEISNQIRSVLENPELVDNPLSQHYELMKKLLST